MPKIYAEADWVLVWLGAYDANEANGVEALHRSYYQSYR